MNRELPPGNGISPFCRDLERQARRHPVHILHIEGAGRRPLGLLLVENGCTGREVLAALAELRLEDRQFRLPAEELARSGALAQAPGQARDACQVTVEERAQLFGFLHKDTRP